MTDDANLAPLMVLQGDWQGQGHGPYGPYMLETSVVLRGRWLLLTSSTLDPISRAVTYVSTQMYGSDADGLLLHFYDTAGSFRFKGARTSDGLRFDWQQGPNWKSSEYWPEPGGSVMYRYESVFPAQGSELFEGVWIPAPAKRP